MRARKGEEAKRRSSPHAGAHAREYASISVYLMERGPDTFSLGGVVRGAVCGLDLEVFIHILDTNGGVEDQRCSLLSPRVTSTRKRDVLFIGTQFSNLYTAVDTPVKEREGARARKGGEAKRSPKAVVERACKKTAIGSK